MGGICMQVGGKREVDRCEGDGGADRERLKESKKGSYGEAGGGEGLQGGKENREAEESRKDRCMVGKEGTSKHTRIMKHPTHSSNSSWIFSFLFCSHQRLILNDE